MNTSQNIKDLFAKLSGIITLTDATMLFFRMWIAKIFYLSGRTKAGDGYLELNDFAPTLFEEEYQVPFLSPEFAAQLALYGETFLPIMLIVGLGARFGAFGLLVMTAVIQYVYPNLFAEHIVWAAALIGIILIGPGKLSLDHLIAKRA